MNIHEKHLNASNIAHSSRVEEVKAHKFLLALASTYFHQMIYNTPGGCDLSEVMTINVENTSKEAVEKMIYFLYNHPIGLDNVSLATLFHMVDLAERFCLPSLKHLLEIHLNSLNTLTTSDIMEAATAVFNLTCFSSSLLDCCAKVLAKGRRSEIRKNSREFSRNETLAGYCLTNRSPSHVVAQ